MVNTPSLLKHLPVLYHWNKTACILFSCNGVSDPTDCKLLVTLRGKKFIFKEIEAFPGTNSHFHCVCKDFELPSLSFQKNAAITVGLAVIPVTIVFDNNGADPIASNNEGSIVVFDPGVPLLEALKESFKFG